MAKCKVPLKRAWSRIDEHDFEDVLCDEMIPLASYMPLQHMCNEGGWPDDGSLELTIDSIDRTTNQIRITLNCYFEEVVPTGCSDISMEGSGQGSVELVLDLTSREAYLDLPDDEG
jgi:hypothetical protein